MFTKSLCRKKLRVYLFQTGIISSSLVIDIFFNLYNKTCEVDYVRSHKLPFTGPKTVGLINELNIMNLLVEF
jgi:hypothetical protein